MNNILKIVLSTALIGTLAACQTMSNKAPVYESGDQENRALPPAKPSDAKSGADEKPFDPRAFYVVKRGDTLLRIALDHGQSYADIVSWNNIANPNDIKVDQVLRIAPPDGSTASQTSAVSLPPPVEVKALPPINPATNKSGPRGEKRTYSEANLAELQKPDAGAPVATSPTAIPVKPADAKPITAVEQAVDWMWPTDGKVVATFDDVKSKGLDISGKAGQDVRAAAAGKVMYEGSGIRGYGNLVIIKHTNSLISAYAYNKVNLVKEGQTISKGQKIAEMGNSDTDAVKLHFEIRKEGKPVDPSKFLPGR